MIYGAGDLGTLRGDLWDTTANALDTWAQYFLAVNGFQLSAADEGRAVIGGFQDRFKTWTWAKQLGPVTVPMFQLTKDIYRSHNQIFEEIPKLWEFARHYSAEVDANGNVVRYYSPSGFKVAGDEVQIYPLLPVCSSPSDPALAQGMCTPPLTARVVPSVINMRSPAGLVSVVLQAAAGYQLSAWNVGQLALGNVPAISVAKSADGSVVVAVFPKTAIGTASGNTMLSIHGMLERNGKQGPFTVGASAQVLR
jgi:hypothetical protein